MAFAAGFFYVQTKRPFSYLWRAAVHLDLSRIANDDMREAAAEADTLLLEFYANHRWRLAISCLCYLVAWSLGPLEIYILLLLLHEPVTWQIALLVEVFGQLIERVTFMIPAKLVSQEGGKALVMAMLGYPADVGFAVGLLRRFKEMVWVFFRPFEPDPSSTGRRARRPREGRVAGGFGNQQRARGTIAMKQKIAVFACVLTVAGLGGIARAGVVIDEQVTTSQSGGAPVVHSRELMVQGHKEKMVSEHNTLVIDLDKGTMMLVDPNQKIYAEIPFPPHRSPNSPGQQLDLNFQKTGKSTKVLDYGCDEYSGRGQDSDGLGLDLWVLLDQRTGRRGVHRVHQGDELQAQRRTGDGGQDAQRDSTDDGFDAHDQSWFHGTRDGARASRPIQGNDGQTGAANHQDGGDQDRRARFASRHVRGTGRLPAQKYGRPGRRTAAGRTQRVFVDEESARVARR